MSTLNTLLRVSLLKKNLTSNTRQYHNTKGRRPEWEDHPRFYEMRGHSPMQASRHKIEEWRSKIFFESPPIPNRIPKYFALFSAVMIITTGMRDKIKKRHKKFVRQQERKMFQMVLPFVQAMEDLRATALDQKHYMLIKSISDLRDPRFFEHVRWRYHQEDIYAPELGTRWRFGSTGKVFHNQKLLNFIRFEPNTFWDKGLFDTRELGYVY
jgi:hypothetical protein